MCGHVFYPFTCANISSSFADTPRFCRLGAQTLAAACGSSVGAAVGSSICFSFLHSSVGAHSDNGISLATRKKRHDFQYLVGPTWNRITQTFWSVWTFPFISDLCFSALTCVRQVLFCVLLWDSKNTIHGSNARRLLCEQLQRNTYVCQCISEESKIHPDEPYALKPQQKVSVVDKATQCTTAAANVSARSRGKFFVLYQRITLRGDAHCSRTLYCLLFIQHTPLRSHFISRWWCKSRCKLTLRLTSAEVLEPASAASLAKKLEARWAWLWSGLGWGPEALFSLGSSWRWECLGEDGGGFLVNIR